MKITKRILSISLVFIALFVCLTCLSTQNVQAATTIIGPPAPTYITSINQQTNNNSIVISWKAIPGVDYYEIQYSTNIGFSQNVKTIKVQGATKSSYTISNTLYPDTTYYFRIRSVDSSLITTTSDWSTTKKFSYSLVTPAITNLSVYDDIVKLAWNNTADVTNGYEIEYSTNQSFLSNVHRFQITSDTQTSLSFDNLMTPGIRYYFRVRTIKAINSKAFFSGWSNPKSIVYSLKQPTASSVQVYDDHFVVSWQRANNTDHIIQISDNSTFDNILMEAKSSNSQYVVKKGLISGKSYYVRICSTVRGHVSPWSDMYKFVYKMKPATIKQTSVNGTSLNLTWSYASPATGCRIEYSTSKAFDKTVYFVEKGAVNSYTINNIKPGLYYVRIKAKNAIDVIDGMNYKNEADWSTITSFTILPQPTSIYSMSVSDQRIALKWNPLGNCSGYEVEYSTYEDFSNKKTIKVNGGSTGYLEIKNDLIPGKRYFIRIRSVDTSTSAALYSKWSYPKSFSYQLRNTYIKTMSLSNSNIKVTWQPYDVYSGYEIQYGSDPNFTNCKVIGISGWQCQDYVLSENIVPGVQYIRIRGYKIIDGQKYFSGWSNIKTISYKLSKTYIKTMRLIDSSIQVDWLVTNGCTGYEIQYGPNSNMTNSQTLKVSSSTVGSTYLKNVTPGTCYVRIRAYKTVNGVNYYSDWSNIKSIPYKLNKTYLTNLYITNNKATVYWQSINGCTGYEIQYAKQSSFSGAKTINVTGAHINKYGGIGLIPGVNYLRIRSYVNVNGTKYYSDWSNAKSLTMKVSGTSIKSIVNQYNKVTVSWAMNSQCAGYELQYSPNQSFASNVKSFTFDKYNVSAFTFSPTPGQYHFRIRTYIIVDGMKYYSDWSSGTYFNFKITGTKLQNAYNDGAYTYLSWDISKGAHGYQLQISPYQTFDKLVKNVYIGNTNTISHLIKEGPSSAITYARIRAYKIIDGQKYYSDWSPIAKIQYQ